MIHKIKTVRWEVRSHGFTTILSETGRVVHTMALFTASSQWTRGYIKGMIWHLQDILKCTAGLAKQLQAQKSKQRVSKEGAPSGQTP